MMRKAQALLAAMLLSLTLLTGVTATASASDYNHRHDNNHYSRYYKETFKKRELVDYQHCKFNKHKDGKQAVYMVYLITKYYNKKGHLVDVDKDFLYKDYGECQRYHHHRK